MVDVRRVTLPGVGVLHSFITDRRRRGRRRRAPHRPERPRDLPAGEDDDDATTIRLDEEEARTLAELLGGTRIVESIAELDGLPGVPIDWITVDDDDAMAGRSFGEVPAASGVALVAVVRDDHAHPSPAADFAVRAGDTIVAVGPTEGIAAVFRAIRQGAGSSGDAEA